MESTSKKVESIGTKPRITNIVATGRLPKEIDIVRIYREVDFPENEYEPETYPALLVNDRS